MESLNNNHLPPYASVTGKHLELAQIREEWLCQKLKDYVDRPSYLSQIKNFIQQNEKSYLLVFAPVGIGKSTLLAKFITSWQNESKDIPVIFHFVRITGPGHELFGMLWHIAEQLYKNGIISDPPSRRTYKLRLQIRQALEKSQRKFILVVDGLDQLEESGKDMSWLPRQISSHIKIILSTQPKRPWDKLQTYSNLENLKLPEWNTDEMNQLLKQLCKNKNICLEKDSVKSFDISEQGFLLKRANGNPLYLKVAFAELQAHPISTKGLALSIEHLFEQVLERLYEQFGQHIVQDYLGLIIASRAGVLESELKEILTLSNSQDYPPISEIFFQKIMQALQHLLTQHQGLIYFLHSEFAYLIQQRFGKFSMRSYHRRLASYFQNKGFGYQRTLYELSYQYRLAEQYSKVLELLTDISFLETKCNVGMLLDLIHDFKRALTDYDASIPANAILNYGNGIIANRTTLQILYQALMQNFSFLYEHPQSIFQCLWNSCYWYDAPESASYYRDSSNVSKAENKIYLLMEQWRSIKENSEQKLPWFKSLRPLEYHVNIPIVSWQDHEKSITSVAVKPDGTIAASASQDGNIIFRHIPTGKFLRMLSNNAEEVRQICFSPDGTILASVGQDTKVRLWKTSTGDCIKILHGHKMPVNTVAFSNDGRRLVTGSEDAIRVWDTMYGRNLFTINDNLPKINCCLITYDNHKIIAGLANGNIHIYKLETGILSHQFKAHSQAISDIMISDDQSFLISASEDKNISVWDLHSLKHLFTLTGHTENISGIDITSDSSKLVSSSQDGTVRLWNLSNGKNIKTWGDYATNFTCCRFLPDGKRVLAGTASSQVIIWDTSIDMLQLSSHTSKITTLATTSQGNWIATGAKDCSIILWNKHGQVIRTFENGLTPITKLAFSSNEKYLISITQDGANTIWDIVTGKIVETSEDFDISDDNTFIENSPYIVKTDYQSTILLDKTIQQPLLYFPQILQNIKILDVGVLIGHTSGNYIAILKIL